MVLQLFWNGLSSPGGVVHRDQAVAFLIRLIGTVRAAKTIDNQLILNCEEPLNNFSLGGEFSIASLRNAGELAEESQYLKALNNRAPFNRVLGMSPGVDANGFEYKMPAGTEWAGATASALGLAHRLKGLAISVPSNPVWCSRSISLDLLELIEDGTTNQSAVNTRNASEPADLTYHEASLRADYLPLVSCGADVWVHRAALFPSLDFIPRTRQQIECLFAGNPMLEQLLIKLSSMNRAASAWAAGTVPHPVFPFNVRPESRSRRSLTRFKDANGVELIFSDHADLAPTEGRIHYIVMPQPRRHVLVGHVGRKLGIG